MSSKEKTRAIEVSPNYAFSAKPKRNHKGTKHEGRNPDIERKERRIVLRLKQDNMNVVWMDKVRPRWLKVSIITIIHQDIELRMNILGNSRTKGEIDE